MEVTHLTESSRRNEGFRITTNSLGTGDTHIYVVERRSDGVLTPAERYRIDGDTGVREQREAAVTDAVRERLEAMGFEVES